MDVLFIPNIPFHFTVIYKFHGYGDKMWYIGVQLIAMYVDD